MTDADLPLSDEDADLFESIVRAQERHDPLPAGMLDRIALAVSLELMNAELAVLADADLVPARADVETVTFTASSVSLMVTWAPVDGLLQLSGWITGGGVRVDLHSPAGTAAAVSDATGRLSWPPVPGGTMRFVIHPVQGGDVPVATPPIEIQATH